METNNNIPILEEIYKNNSKFIKQISEKENKLKSLVGKEKFNLLDELCKLNRNINPKKTLKYAKQAFKISEKFGNEIKAKSYYNLGMGYLKCGEEKNAIDNFHKALNLFEEACNDKWIANSLDIIGSVYTDFSKLDQSEKYLEKAFTIYKKIDDKVGLGRIFLNEARNLTQKNEYSKAFKNCEKSLIYFQKMNDKEGEAHVYNEMFRIASKQSRYDDAMNYAKQSLKISYTIGNLVMVAIQLENLGSMERFKDNYKQSRLLFKNSLHIFSNLDQKDNLADIYNNLGALNFDLGNFKKSLKYQEKSLDISKKLGNKNKTNVALNGIGICHVKLGNLKEGLKYLIDSLKIKRELGKKGGIAKALNNIGYIYYTLDNYDKALKYYKEAAVIKRKNCEKASLVNTLNNIALINTHKNKYKKSIEYYKEALEIAEKLKLNKLVGIIKLNIGEVYVQTDRNESAKKYYKKSIKIFENIQDKPKLAVAKISLAKIFIRLRKFEKGENLILSALDLTNNVNSPDIKLKVYMIADSFYKNKKDFKKAYKYFKLYAETKNKLASKEIQNKISELEAKYENENKTKEIEKLKNEKKIQSLKQKMANDLNKQLEEKVNERTKKLKKSRKQYRDLFNQISDGVVILQDGRIKLFNNEFRRLLKYSEEKYKNALFIDFVDSQYKKFLIDNSSNNKSNSIISDRKEVLLVSQKGKNISATLNIKSIEYESKSALQITLRDITQRKIADKKIIHAETLTGISELAGGFAHEIKNPISNVSSSVQMLQSEFELTDEVKAYLDIIRRNVDKANEFVKKLNDFAKPHEKEMKSVNIESLINSCLTLMKGKLRNNNINVNVDGCDYCPLIYGDKIYLQSAFINLILNSIQACKNDGKINIKLNHLDGHIKIEFIDNGEGISKEKQESIFNPFYTTKKEGSGLGLTMVKKVINEHKGTIKLDSVLGKGANFKILLPIKSSNN